MTEKIIRFTTVYFVSSPEFNSCEACDGSGKCKECNKSKCPACKGRKLKRVWGKPKVVFK